ncbi:MAG: M20/M25/M40 family metallo-hydrolase [Pseudomonadota bacterium]|nr:M20/M25/M40 family metallo-hydrolase [Pseudomonadota bacterium]
MKNVLLSCAVIAGFSWAALGWAATSGPIPPATDQSLGREIFKELVEMNTTHQRGSTEAAQAIQRRLLGAGFLASDVVVIAPSDRPAKANVVVRYHGKGSGTAVLFIAHLDVVDAKAEDWSVDPFKLTEKDGWFYGRGTMDMKDGDAALLETLIRLKREHFVPDRDVIAAFTADEEAGGDANGPAFLLKEHRSLIDAGLVLSLDGGGGDYKNGQRHVFRVNTSEKVYVTYTLETTSPGGHGSLPGPDNAIYRLAEGLIRLEAHKFPVMLTATTRASFKRFADLDASPQSADMRAVANDPPDLAAADRLSQIVRLNAQLRTTCVATLISGGHAENALPQRAKATIQCRMMPGDTAEHIQSELTSTLSDAKIRVTLDAPPIVGRESPPDPKLFARLTRVVDSMWPGVPVVPTMATGFGDARQTTNAGMPTYDLGGRWMDQDENRAHGRDERIGVREFDESVEYTYRLVKEMSRQTS